MNKQAIPPPVLPYIKQISCVIYSPHNTTSIFTDGVPHLVTSRVWSSRKGCSINSTCGTLEYVVQMSNETAWAQNVLNSNTTYMVAWRSRLRSFEYFKFSPNCQHISGRTFTMEESYLPISRFVGVECGVRQITPASIAKVCLHEITNHLLQERQITNFGNIFN